MHMPEKTPLTKWLNKKYLEWQTQEEESKTVIEFADYLNVNRSLLSYWMNGKRIPNEENCEKISVRLGNEIYDVLEIPRPNPYLQKLNRIWEFLPEDAQERISREAESYEAQNISKRVQTISKRRKASSNK